MADLNDLIEDPNAKLSRRNVVVGTAWAVPVIMAVGAAPAMAASGDGVLAITAIDTASNKKHGTLSGTRTSSGGAVAVSFTHSGSFTYSLTQTGTTWSLSWTWTANGNANNEVITITQNGHSVSYTIG